MTLEQIRSEAAKHGYKLAKEYPNTKLKPCICGNSRYTRVTGLHTKAYRCMKCGFTADEAKYLYEAKIKWNECVENARKEQTNDQL